MSKWLIEGKAFPHPSQKSGLLLLLMSLCEIIEAVETEQERRRYLHPLSLVERMLVGGRVSGHICARGKECIRRGAIIDLFGF